MRFWPDKIEPEPVPVDDSPMTPAEMRLRQRLILLQVTVNRMLDQVKMLMVIVALAVLVGGVAGYRINDVATDSKSATTFNGQQGLGNRELLCIATNAPGNDIPKEVLAKLDHLCNRDFSHVR